MRYKDPRDSKKFLIMLCIEHYKNGIIFRIKPSPMKVEKATPDGKKTTRIKISFREGQLQSPLVDIRNPCSAAKAAVAANAASELETSTASNNRSTSKNGSFKVNESLSNLRQDISSMIEQSFGPFQVIESSILSKFFQRFWTFLQYFIEKIKNHWNIT